ncbi:MAG: hypothetical protein K2X37_04655 [Chitinophagaceae bacterium]|nr:hypothetical protein [Chitinophagaceae bacterium]
MTTTLIRQKIYDYIKTADDKKVKAIYTIFEDTIEQSYDPFENERLVPVLDKRRSEFLKDKSRATKWEDAKKKILSSNKAK